MKTNTPFNIIFLKIICSTFKSQTNSSILKILSLKNKKYIFSIFFIEKKCSNFKINRLQKLNFLELSRKFLMAVLGHHTYAHSMIFGFQDLVLVQNPVKR